MCLASRHINSIEEILKGIEDDHAKLVKKLSEYDKTISNIYHDLETRKFNAAEGYYIAKDLQDIVQKRRLVKDELYRLRELHKSLEATCLNEKIPQIKKATKKAKNRAKNWCKNFNFTFSDIEEEVMH